MFSYPKNEKLKKKKHIDLLFEQGKTVSNYPLRLVYVPLENEENAIQFGVSVSKRYFKKAVDRNYYKRVLRECYRLNQHILKENIFQPYAIMFFYQTKEHMPYKEIFEKTKVLFQKFIETISVQQIETS
ncbi:ribonuclease P protein component [Capnocytophaga sp. ARDL2]|uniref:ribonuclease P protein component n=1 Tax=Capnocytophaga sp. ARDL2 TaxID=3238809 RepID=UPI00355863D3